ncbi:MAG: Asp-tRNA(Asn)/Glu-tRNA(Gln) amidotransferase subunit GatB [Acidimicrobiales bacterium]
MSPGTRTPGRREGAGGPGGWETVVGLEVHTELLTATKLFCSCRNAFGDEPNTNACPVCLGLPGSLPVLNAAAVELAARIGLALHSEIRPSLFHRKNYFYPDMPKDYQISQYDEPICSGGWLELPGGARIGIVRAHLEEDTGKTTHVGGDGRIHGAAHALVDYNRAGVPLVEIVSEPDLRSAEQARSYVAELRRILVAIGASDGRMEEGSVRVDANVSVRRGAGAPLGTRCEIKNLNSLRSLGRAIEHEAARQADLLYSGGTVAQETRHWLEDEGRTVAMRSKEEAFDYRYFPEPDLVPLSPGDDLLASVAAAMPPLPAERRHRLAGLLGEAGSTAAVADQIATVVELGLDDLVHEAVTTHGAPGRLALARGANEAAANPEAARSLAAESFAALVRLESDGRLGASQAKAVLAEMLAAGGGDPAEIAAAKGFEALPTDQLEGVLDEIAGAHPAEWERYLQGDEKVAGFLVGQVMRATRGRADGKAAVAALAARRRG